MNNLSENDIARATKRGAINAYSYQMGATMVGAAPRFGHRKLQINGSAVFAGRTGYTGEDGFELLLSAPAGQALWQQLLEAGVTPCGLGARDSLRLEAASSDAWDWVLNDEG